MGGDGEGRDKGSGKSGGRGGGKGSKGAGRKGGAATEAGASAAASSKPARWAPRAVQPPQEEAVAAPEEEADAGPTYSRGTLLAALTVQRASPAEAASEDAAPPGDAERSEVTTTLSERPENVIVPSRRALLEARKEQKMLKRLGSSGAGPKMDPNAEAFVPSSLKTPTTPGGTRISLAAAMEEEAEYEYEYEYDAAAATASFDGMAFPGVSPEMLQYLYSMAIPPAFAAGMMGVAAASAATQAAAGFTTVMLRNIPNRYTRDMLLERLNSGYKDQFDFMYLPIDFNSKCNVGYAFVNFRAPVVAQRFIQEFHGVKARQCLPGFSSKKVCEVSYATVQGREANMENFRDEKFVEKLKERPDWHPLFFDNKGAEISLSKVLSSSASSKRRAPVPATPPSTPYGAMMSPTGAFSPFGMGMMPTPFGMMPAMPPYPSQRMPSTPSAQSRPSLSGVLPGATGTTMLMLRGVPRSWTREQFIEMFTKKYPGAFDFLFVPGEFRSGVVPRGGQGHVFINFRKTSVASKFSKEFDQKKASELFGVEEEEEGDKECEVQAAKLEVLSRTIERFQAPPKKSEAAGDPLVKAAERAAWSPLLFGPDGESKPLPLLTQPVKLAGALPS